MRSATVVISIGDRPWFPITDKRLHRYATRHGHDVVVCNRPHWHAGELPPFRHAQNLGRVQKLGIGRYFDRYDRILLLDDTCLVSPEADDVIATTPYQAIGAMLEYRSRRDREEYLSFHEKLYQRSARLARDSFFNGGVVVLSQAHRALFDPKQIPWDRIAADPAFPVHGYLSHQAETLGFPIHDLGLEYNFCGSQIRGDGGAMNLPGNVKIFHLTSALTPGQRQVAANRIDQLFSKTSMG